MVASKNVTTLNHSPGQLTFTWFMVVAFALISLVPHHFHGLFSALQETVFYFSDIISLF